VNRFLLPLGMFALLAVVLGIGIRNSPEKGVVASPLIGKPAPQFSLPSLTDAGLKISSSELRGHWYLLNVWGTWCVACREEHNTLLEIRKAGIVPLVGIDWRDEDGQAREWLSQLGDPYESVAVDRDGREAIEWGVTMAPESFLVNPQGIIVYKCTGELTHEIFEREIVPRVTRSAAAPQGL
jgi:cytochrome c biogenesis protein CcmG, thiol:disulfide interchange protein DsbE